MIQTADMDKAFEAMLETSRLPAKIKDAMRLSLEVGRDDQIETWAERLDGDPSAERGRGDRFARCLPAATRKAVAASRAHRAEVNPGFTPASPYRQAA